MYGVIYKVTNKINGKVYIGQTYRSLKKRMKEHKFNALHTVYNSLFHAAIRKYGFDNFEWEVIVECKSEKMLDRLEIKAIKDYESMHRLKGYNLTKGGSVLRGKNNPFYGKKHSEDVKKKISSANKGRKGYNTGKTLSKETRMKISNSLKCIMSGKNNPMYGKKHTEQTKIKISESHKGKKIPEKYLKHLIKEWLVIYPDNITKVISNLNKFCKKNNLNQGNMTMVADGKYDNHKGYKCKRLYSFSIEKLEKL